MNQRVLMLASLLVLPLVLIVFLAQTPETSNMKPVKPEEPVIKPGSMSKVSGRLPQLGAGAPTKEQQKPPRRPPTLEEAKERLRKELARLETLTPEAWEQEQREREERRRERMQKEREHRNKEEKKL